MSTQPAYLRFWGVRGSYAAPFATHLGVGGNTSCVEIRVGDRILVCDAGTGIIPLGEQLLAQRQVRELLVILTHYHWDHICGLPFFTPAFSPEWTLRFFGPGESAGDVERALAEQMKAPYFPVETETWLARVEYLSAQRETLESGPFRVRHYNVHHPGVTYGYRIEVAGQTVVYVSDNEFSFLGESIRRQAATLSAEEQGLFEQIEREERQQELKLLRGADILIADAQYTPEDYALKRGWGHSCYIDTVNAAIDAEVRRLYLFHHDPGHDDASIAGILAHCRDIVRQRGAALECEVAHEGLVVELGGGPAPPRD